VMNGSLRDSRKMIKNFKLSCIFSFLWACL
jgi:hypothetical protein